MDIDKQRISDFLKSKGLRAKEFKKGATRKSKTPDYRVFKSEHLAFFCELKSISPDEWLDNQLRNAPPVTLVGGGRKDPVYNRISNKIHEAYKQFDAVNSGLEYPNVLAFVNHDEMCDARDLFSVITGDFLAEGGVRLPIYRKFSEGRIKEENLQIHLYIWIDDFEENFFLFNTIKKEHFIKLYEYFHIDSAAIKNMENVLIMMKIPNK